MESGIFGAKRTVQIPSKLPQTGTSIFTRMSALAAEHNAINLSQGFPNFDPDPELIDLVYAHLRAGHNQYAHPAGVPLLRQRLAQHIERTYDRPTDFETDINITSGATQALFTAITTVVSPGDEVILFEPAYDSYRPAVELNGGTCVPYLLHPPDFRIDWEAVGRLITERTRLIILNTPHNPTGTLLGPDDWAALEALVEGTDILVLSDEVYEHLVFDGHQHHSVLARPRLRERAMATFSFGKTFHSTGWKIGYIVAPEPLLREFRKIHQFVVFTVHTPTQYALADYLTTSPDHHLATFYAAKRDLLRGALVGSGLQPLPSYGSYFQLYDYSALRRQSDTEFAEWLTIEHGVATIPVSAFVSAPWEHTLIRLCFAKTDEVLEQAGRVVSSYSTRWF